MFLAGRLWALMLCCIPLLANCPSPVTAQALPPFLWIEAEEASLTPESMKPNISGWGRKEFLSGEKWLQISVDENAIEKSFPNDGVTLRYRINVTEAGNYEIWNRIGFEFVRSAFEWRMDNGAWSRITSDALTTDLMELERWNEIAWIKMGGMDLSAGSHTLEIRLPKLKDEKGKFQRVLYAADAFCLTRGKFSPNGKFRPGEEGRSDADRAAEKNVFVLPEPTTSGVRTTIPLKGDWEVCRNDEQTPPFDVAIPMKDFPEKPVWKAIAVPSDKNVSRPDLLMAHRLWYRTRVNIPASHRGRSFFLTFPRNSLNTTVYVNGVFCGFEKNPNVRFNIDITPGIKPGQTNEIWVGIRDVWYGRATSPKDPMKLRRQFNLPVDYFSQGFQDLAYPIWNASQSGIVQIPTLTSAGGVYASDVFVKPNVAKKELVADITIRNTSKADNGGFVTCTLIDANTNMPVKAFAPIYSRDASSGGRGGPIQDLPLNTVTLRDQGIFRVSAGQETTISVRLPFSEAKLWWPVPNPQLYRLGITVSSDNTAMPVENKQGKIEDHSETRFGFREWGSKGKDFTLNGIVWHGWADLNFGSNPAEWLTNYRKTNQRFMRLSGYAQGGPLWFDKTPTEALNFFDENGIVVRRSGDLDGEAIGYMAIENDPDIKALYKSEIKVQLLNNWRDQMIAQVKGERNHPSIHVWSIENEWLYINCINLYGGLMDEFEKAEKVVMDAVMKTDPTRLAMADGGGAGKDNLFPVHGDHYVFGDMTRYPALAYEMNPSGGGRGRWVWDGKRPRYPGEDFFASGINPFDYAYFGGEETFVGKSNTKRAAGIIQTMLTAGYRWAEFGAFHFWLGSESALNQYGANADLAVFCKEWDSAFPSGGSVPRNLGIFNDQFQDDEPITLTSTVSIDGKNVTTVGKYTVPPGTNRKFTLTLAIPAISSARAEGNWILQLTQGGKERYRNIKAISVLNPAYNPSKLNVALVAGAPLGGFKPVSQREKDYGRSGKTSERNPSIGLALSAPESVKTALVVYDPQGATGAYLKAQKIRFTLISALNNLPKDDVLLIGRDALTEAESASSTLAAWAAGGGRLVILEQKFPLKYQGLPAQMEPSQNVGRTAFIEDESHPALSGLKSSDFFAWPAGEVVYRNAYEKPTRGAQSLIQCDNRLARSALTEIPVGDGLMVVSQLRIAETLKVNPVAQQLLLNLLKYAGAYKRETRPVVAALADDAQLGKALESVGVVHTRVNDPLKAISLPGQRIAVIGASPANLKTLAANLPLVRQFNGRGGWILFAGLTPEGLADYNKIVGVNHMIRPFRRERVTFPPKRSPLTAGLSIGDIALTSGERINGFSDDQYMASDVFSYIVDYDEVAPFAKLPEPSYWGNSDGSNDHNPYNIVNGFTSADGWQLIFSMWAGPGGKPNVPMTFPKYQEITAVEWTGNAFYYPTKKFELLFDGKNPVEFKTVPDNSTQNFQVPTGRVGKEITINITEFEKAKEPSIVGIDNIRLFAKRPPEFYRTVRPLLNIGALMAYDRGTGGIVLSNIKFQETEAAPENQRKKRNILATVLRNLKAPFSGGATVIAGAALNYTPLDISKQANQFRNEQGWFGDKSFTFRDLPTGRQTFSGVPFDIYQFATSSVPNTIMLGGSGIPNNLPDAVRGIPVNRKADALFFLQAARIDNRRNNDEIRDRKRYEMARYVVTYADGQNVNVPIYSEIDVDDYKQETPRSLPGAQIGWIKKYEGTPQTAVAYVKQWDNPRPGIVIQSVALEYGADKRGVPALMAITAASAR